MRRRFICVQNGRRDDYQVPVALEEAGLLERLVVDFYAPDWLPAAAPGLLRGRRAAGLPPRRTRSVLRVAIVEAALRRLGRGLKTLFPVLNRILAREGLRAARAANAHLYCYSSYVPKAGERPADMRLISFAYHPLPGLTEALLRADHALYPETADSFRHEEEQFGGGAEDDSWRDADAIVCASAMTRRSLEHAGCPPAKITVIPYGLGGATIPAVSARPPGPCRFLFVGQGVQRKGLHHLIRAWQAADLGDATLTLICYQHDPGIAATIRSPAIRLLGKQPRERLEDAYAAADVFVMPSIIEGFGLVYGEALERGCHVVGTPNTGLPDLPLSDEERTLVPVGDLDALREALQALARRKAEGGLDAPAIARRANSAWSWADFKRGVARHAGDALDGWSAERRR